MGLGDYLRYHQFYSGKTTDVDLAAATAGIAAIIVPKSANHIIYIQKITVAIVTSAAQALTFRDNGAPVNIAVVPASQTGTVVIDFGPRGTPLTVGKQLDLSNTAGPAARIHIEAYERLRNDGTAVALASTN